MANGETRSVIGTFGVIASVILFIVMISTGAIASGEIVGCCCWGVIFAVIAESGRTAKKNTDQQMMIAWQPQPVQQPVVIQHHYAAPTTQTQPASNTGHVQGTAPLERQSIEAEKWITKARNLEMARDWEGAAQAYQEAGLYHEAGRVRQEHLEKDKSGVNINLKSGDTYHDSVVMKDNKNNENNQP